MGLAGRRRAEELYDVTVGTRAWTTLLEQLAGRHNKAA
jgi:hypothetical protein